MAKYPFEQSDSDFMDRPDTAFASETELLRFVADSEAHGFADAARRQFPDSVADRWDSDWRAWLATPRVEVKVAEIDRRNADPASKPIILAD